MRKTKLIGLISALTEEEMKQFDSFVNCYMFNPRSVKVSELFAAIYSFYPEFDVDESTKQAVWSKIYPTNKYNVVVLRNLISDLFNLLRRFLVHLRVDKDETELSKHLLEELFMRGAWEIEC